MAKQDLALGAFSYRGGKGRATVLGDAVGKGGKLTGSYDEKTNSGTWKEAIKQNKKSQINWKGGEARGKCKALGCTRLVPDQGGLGVLKAAEKIGEGSRALRANPTGGSRPSACPD